MTTDSNFSPAFWDNLSEALLTRRALRELDRRNSARSPPKAVQRNVRPSKLARFARHGGPNLNHLRGYLEPKKAIRSKSSSPSPSRCTTSTAPSLDSEDRHSSAYDENFTNHLIDHGIYPEGHEHPDGRATPEPCNLNDTRHELLNPRASLSPTLFTASMFRDFKRNNRADSKGTLMQNVIPMIAGNASTPNEGNIAFTNLTPLTDEATVTAMPDSFDGTRPSEVHSVVKHDLSNLVVPAKHENDPVTPNFFLEAKAPSGSALVVENQACYDGAHGARAIHALQNYGRTESTDNYDGNAYAYSST